MKKVLTTVLCIAVAVSLLCGAFLYVSGTPEYALLKTCLDVKSNGFEAILPHLTDSAYKKVEPIIKIVNNGFVQSILSFISDEVRMLVEKASEVNWSIGEMMKSSEKATVTVGFNHKEKIVGSIDIELTKVDGEWKISNFYNFKITKFSL